MTNGTVPLRAHGRSLADFGELASAERLLLQKCRCGENAVVAETLPTEATAENRVRAGFVRFLALGGDDQAPVHEYGVVLQGAWIVDPLVLDGATIPFRLGLWACRIERIQAQQAKLKILALDGSRLEQGLAGDGLTCDGDLFLKQGFHCQAEICLLGANIGGDLDCREAVFERPGEDVLTFDRSTIGGSVFLRRGFSSTGRVRLFGATIAGNLDCHKGSFANAAGDALSCNGASVARGFVFRELRSVTGTIDLTAMRVDSLCDDAASWSGASAVALDGFSYQRLADPDGLSDSPTDATMRILWLERQPAQHLGKAFRPAPWDQLIAVLKAMGHPNEARRVAIAKQARLRRAGRVLRGTRVFHWFYGVSAGYGYRPMRVLVAAGVMWAACGLAYWGAANPGWFGASTALIVPAKSEPSPACLVARARAQSGDPCPDSKPDYRGFAPFIYSTDVMLPVVDLGYRSEWRVAVSDRTGRWGEALRYLYWLQIAFGWVAGILLVAVLGNLLKKE